jgi:alpha-glucosidase
VVARKSGKDWYLGAINDNQSFNTNLQLNFLEAGKTYRAFLWKDGVNAERFAEDYAMETLLVRKGDPFPVSLCRAGGLAVRFVENP